MDQRNILKYFVDECYEVCVRTEQWQQNLGTANEARGWKISSMHATVIIMGVNQLRLK